jgi:hypothetical protein
VFQERARGDLDAREKAIGDPVRPLADSRSGRKIRELGPPAFGRSPASPSS